ncbi:MAG: helix-turn-helix transcriptional regulator [Coriobacteriales bacterium]|nr:helix-turn-helix transcriptional regulator [Coriobacteriales bacterium]
MRGALFSRIFSRPLRCFLGLAFLEAQTQLLYASNVLLVSSVEMLPLSITHLFSTVAVVLAGVVILAFSTRLTPLASRRKLLWALAVAGSLGTVGVSVVSLGVLAPWWMVVCVACTAFSGFVLTLAWVELFATQGVRGALVAYALAVALGWLLGLVLTLLPQALAIPLVAVLPLCSVLSLRPHESGLLVSYADERPRPTLSQLLRLTPWQFILVAGLVNFAFGAVRTSYLPVDPTADTTGQFLLTAALGLVAFIIAGFVALFSFRRNYTIAYYIAIPCIALTCLLLALPMPLPASLMLSVTSVGTDLVRLLVWLLLIAAVATRRVPMAFSFALLTATQFACVLLGQLTAVAADAHPFVVSFAVLLMLLIATLVVVSARTLLPGTEPAPATGGAASLGALGAGASAAPGARAPGVPSAPAAALGHAPPPPVSAVSAAALGAEEQARLLAVRHRLSPREQEVAAIWLAGHTGSYIERTLHISKHTVKTHLGHIYQKTGTTNKEELLALLERLPPQD